MLSSTSLSTLALLISSTAAAINSLSAPSLIKPSTTIPITLITNIGLSSENDIAVAFGLQPAATYNNLSISGNAAGLYLGSYFLGSANGTVPSVVSSNTTLQVDVPAGIKTGDYVLTGAVYTLIGAMNTPQSVNFPVNVTVGGATSAGLAYSWDAI